MCNLENYLRLLLNIYCSHKSCTCWKKNSVILWKTISFHLIKYEIFGLCEVFLWQTISSSGLESGLTSDLGLTGLKLLVNSGLQKSIRFRLGFWVELVHSIKWNLSWINYWLWVMSILNFQVLLGSGFEIFKYFWFSFYQVR